MSASIPEGWSYGPWHDGPDPLQAPVDLRDALDEIGRDVMGGSSPRSALEELLRRGTRNTQGLDDLSRRLWERRRDIQRQHNLDGTLRDVQRLLAETTIATELPASRLPDPAAFAAVTCPVLCLYGGDSPMLELAGPTERLLPQTRTVVLENAGHSMLVDRAADVRGHVVAWLDDLTTTALTGGREGRTHG